MPDRHYCQVPVILLAGGLGRYHCSDHQSVLLIKQQHTRVLIVDQTDTRQSHHVSVRLSTPQTFSN